MLRWPRLTSATFVALFVGAAHPAGAGIPTPAGSASVVASVAHSDVAQAEPERGAPKPDALVSDLQALLSHHATLATRLTRATLTDDPGFVDAAENALVRNISDIDEALTPAVGAETAAQLSGQWERQTQSLFQSAIGVRDDDPDARRQAERQLERVREEQAAALSRLGGGRVDEQRVAAVLRSYFDSQVAQLESFAAGDHERSYELQRRAFADTFVLGLTTAQAAMKVPKPAPKDELQTALSMLLGEHVELAVDTMRSGATGSDDFEAAAGSLDANTSDVVEAMDAMFGSKQARAFNKVWADHIDLFVDYTVAVVEGDDATREAVRSRFDTVMRRFGTTLEAMTGGRADADVVTAAMGEHEHHLIEQIEHYANEDYSAAYEISYTAYQHIRGVADVLAVSFAKAIADDMPRGGSQTGGGGTARR